VGRDEPACRITRDRAQRRRHHRHRRARLEQREVRARARDEVVAGAAAHARDARDRRTARLEQPHVRHAQPRGLAVGVLGLLHARGGVRAAAQREVVTAHDHGATVDPRGADHRVGGRELDEVAVGVGLRHAGDAALLAEAGLVDERVDALAHGQAPTRVVFGDRLGAAQLGGRCTAQAQLLDFLLPRHGGAF
jgi:hypothetical protein